MYVYRLPPNKDCYIDFFFLLWDEKYIHAWLGNEKLSQKNRFYSQIIQVGKMLVNYDFHILRLDPL